MKKACLLLFIFTLPLLCSSNSIASELTINGQASVWAGYADGCHIGLRYIPELRVKQSLTEEKSVDLDFSLKASCSESDTDLDLYRLWLRYMTAQFEARLGLQKISFGPARILRTLMWFDQIDYRDPLGLTDGVCALLGRYYFLNNANTWVWVLFGNNDLKGLELFRTDKDKIEFGGRHQFPLPKGEMALSYNSRYIDQADWRKKKPAAITDGLENRLALDGHWDLGIGLWFETSVSKIKLTDEDSLWDELLTVGTDYTFDVGPGVHLLLEHFAGSQGSGVYEQDNVSNISALSTDFSITMLDSINAIGYYDWKENKVYAYLGWRRTYDNWLINISVFSSAENKASTYSGNGVMFLLTYNH